MTKLEKRFHILKILSLSSAIKHTSIKLPVHTNIAEAYLFNHHTSNTTKPINLQPSKFITCNFLNHRLLWDRVFTSKIQPSYHDYEIVTTHKNAKGLVHLDSKLSLVL